MDHTEGLLRVALLQTNPLWEDKARNLESAARMADGLEDPAVILLPEMFSTGFSMRPEVLAETTEGPTVGWMKELAFRKGAAVGGSLVIREEKCFFNRFVWVFPGGEMHWYDKRHLFTMGDEPLHYTAGSSRVTVEWQGWKIRPLICYDLRFPVWSRNSEGYDLLLYVASWPAARYAVWKSLLVARALENQCYCIGVNRTGRDGMGIRYRGGSGVVSPRGVASWMDTRESAATFTLSLKELHAFRRRFPVLDDRDSFLLD